MSESPLPLEPRPPGFYRLHVPAYPGWITLNQRGAWYINRPKTKAYRELGYSLSLRAAIPRIERARVIAELRFSTNRRRDPHNWTPTAKAIVDGMVDAGVFPDDNHQHVIGPDMRIGPNVHGDTEHIVIGIWREP